MKAIKILAIIEVILLIIEVILFHLIGITPDQSVYGLGALFTAEFANTMILLIIIYSIGSLMFTILVVGIILFIMEMVKKRKEKNELDK